MGKHTSKFTAAGLLIALGIIYGDIGTSPLYVMKAIVDDKVITDALVLGGLSCIIWTLTLQTTFKYVILTLRADNNGEGGIFSLYALVRRRKKWLVIPAMIGGAALLADGIITPPISVTSAIEGLRQIPKFSDISPNTIVWIVCGIISLLFFMQQFGTSTIGKLFGPIMGTWFLMLAILGVIHLHEDWGILKAFNPYYAYNLLTNYSFELVVNGHTIHYSGFWILGAIFLCTTGAEALYSDLGHCGKENIRVSWVFVKICLILNYLGQGAWMLAHKSGLKFDTSTDLSFNPFFDIMPQWFKLPGIIIATTAAIIASQALISGSFTLISEAMRLNLWPKMKINYPTEEKGQLYIPGISAMLWLGCLGVTLWFRESSKMEAAYGLAITMCMISTSILFANYLVSLRVVPVWIYLYLFVYIAIESSFLIANLEKFPHGGFIALIVAGALFFVMYVWYKSRKIKNRYVEFVRLEDYIPQIQELSNDKIIPKYATHLVYMTSANNHKEIEHKIIYSILNRKPKRADIYWFVHVDVMDEPYRMDYKVTHVAADDIIRVDFRLGFRVAPRVNLMFRKVVEDLVKNKEVDITSRYESLNKNNIIGDFKFVVIEKFLSYENELPLFEKIILNAYFILKRFSLSEAKAFGLDSSSVKIEKFPMIINPPKDINLHRIN